MAIQSNDPFDVLRHYILVGFPEGAKLEPLTIALEALSERMDALDNTVRWLAAGKKPTLSEIESDKLREFVAAFQASGGDFHADNAVFWIDFEDQEAAERAFKAMKSIYGQS